MNNLNDLTGKEWVYALRSVITTRYPTRGPESYAHDLRRVHPSPKPPQLMAEFVRFFTKRHGHVLDPFAGVGGTLLACAMEHRTCVGIDLSPTYKPVYINVCERLTLDPQPYIIGDARALATFPEVAATPFDLILTDPPYAGMMAKRKTGQRKKQGNAAATPFTMSNDDLGNLDYGAFLSALHTIIGNALPYLKPKGHVILFTKDLQPTTLHHNMLHADITAKLRDILEFRGYRIWHDQSSNLYPFGYPYAFVSNQQHQFVLIFRHMP